MAGGDKSLEERWKGGLQIRYESSLNEGSPMENTPLRAEVISFPNRLNSEKGICRFLCCGKSERSINLAPGSAERYRDRVDKTDGGRK